MCTLANLESYPFLDQKDLKIIMPKFKLQMKVPIKEMGFKTTIFIQSLYACSI
jgi:hypothetical protein